TVVSSSAPAQDPWGIDPGCCGGASAVPYADPAPSWGEPMLARSHGPLLHRPLLPWKRWHMPASGPIGPASHPDDWWAASTQPRFSMAQPHWPQPVVPMPSWSAGYAMESTPPCCGQDGVMPLPGDGWMPTPSGAGDPA